jgi:hypothetical protein
LCITSRFCIPSIPTVQYKPNFNLLKLADWLSSLEDGAAWDNLSGFLDLGSAGAGAAQGKFMHHRQHHRIVTYSIKEFA